MPIVTKKFTGLQNDKTYFARIYPVNKRGYCQSELTGQVVSAQTFYFPDEPTSYGEVGTYTTDQTITIDQNGWYEVRLFGAGGNGGRAELFMYNVREVCEPLDPDHEQGTQICHDEYSYHQGAGGGGGGGGEATSRVKMKAGDTIVLQIGQPGYDTVATINSSMEQYSKLKVISGENGNDGNASSSSASGGTGGAGGMGYGGNFSNGNGKPGGKGDSVERQDTEDSGHKYPTPGSAGIPFSPDGSYGGTGDGKAGEPGYMILYRGE